MGHGTACKEEREGGKIQSYYNLRTFFKSKTPVLSQKKAQ